MGGVMDEMYIKKQPAPSCMVQWTSLGENQNSSCLSQTSTDTEIIGSFGAPQLNKINLITPSCNLMRCQRCEMIQRVFHQL
jgi:hypothetical protein